MDKTREERRQRDNAKWWIVALIVYFATAGSAWLLAVHQKNVIRLEIDEATRAMQTAIEERNNAEEMSRQWKAMYDASMREVAELKTQNEDLTAQIDALREPPKDAYTELGWDFDYVVRVVGAEARGEPFDGILAVAECIANTAEEKGMTPESVVKEAGQYTNPVSRDVTDGMEDVNEACCMVFLNGERPHEQKIKYFYAYKNGYSSWHEGKNYCFTIGGHKYFSD